MQSLQDVGPAIFRTTFKSPHFRKLIINSEYQFEEVVDLFLKFDIARNLQINSKQVSPASTSSSHSNGISNRTFFKIKTCRTRFLDEM